MAKLSDESGETATHHRRNMAVLNQWLNSTDELSADAVALLLIMIGAARSEDAIVAFHGVGLNQLIGKEDSELLLILNELHSHGYLNDYEVSPWVWHLELNTDAAYDEEDYA